MDGSDPVLRAFENVYTLEAATRPGRSPRTSSHEQGVALLTEWINELDG